jgi:hypothetical protein
MSNKLDVLNPVVELSIGGEKIEVRELAWPEALKFLSMISEHAGQLITGEGKFVVDFTKLTRLVSSTEELSEFLMLKTTGRDEAWLATLSMRNALEVLDAALSVNLSAEMFASGKKIEGRLRSLFGAPAQISTSGSPA